MNAAAPARLTTARLSGRRIGADDLAYVVETDADEAIQRWLSGSVPPPDQSPGRFERWLAMWELHGMGFWIFSDESGAEVGHAGLFASPRDAGSIEVGYALKPAYWGRGYGTEMTREVLRVGFELVGLQRVIGICMANNLASRRVLEKCGLTFERDYDYTGGRLGALYSIERERYD